MQTPDQPKGLRAPNRGAADGNAIWALYRGLNFDQAKDFRSKLTTWNVPFATFRKHTAADRQLGTVPAKNFQLYRNYFLAVSNKDLLSDFYNEQPAARPADALAPATL